MAIYLKNIRYYSKTGKGHFLETPIQSQNISQLEYDILMFLKKKGLDADSEVGKTTLSIKNIRKFEDGKRAPSFVYAQIRQMIATGLENRNMKADVTSR